MAIQEDRTHNVGNGSWHLSSAPFPPPPVGGRARRSPVLVQRAQRMAGSVNLDMLMQAKFNHSLDAVESPSRPYLAGR